MIKFKKIIKTIKNTAEAISKVFILFDYLTAEAIFYGLVIVTFISIFSI